ncbi:hypothetical protein V5F38_04280 [Xanthobacter sp. V0B-10]|uniref:hypothetical protein n=1 Tax=Xanthobacter albus TaxID=3119929 RepID=UPI00372673CD
MWLHFTREFWWSPPERAGRITLRFLAGSTHFVRRLCAAAALAEGAAEQTTRPAR